MKLKPYITAVFFLCTFSSYTYCQHIDVEVQLETLKKGIRLNKKYSKELIKYIHKNAKSSPIQVYNVLLDILKHKDVLTNDDYNIILNIDVKLLSEKQKGLISDRLRSHFYSNSISNLIKYKLIIKYKLHSEIEALERTFPQKTPIDLAELIVDDPHIDPLERLYGYIALANFGVDSFEQLLSKSVIEFYDQNHNNYSKLWSLCKLVNIHFSLLKSNEFIKKTAFILDDHRTIDFGHGGQGTVSSNYLLSISDMLCTVEFIDLLEILEDSEKVKKYKMGIKDGSLLCED
jgi:hypothetical protein